MKTQIKTQIKYGLIYLALLSAVVLWVVYGVSHLESLWH